MNPETPQPTTSPSRLRPLAICLFTYQDKILVAEGHDPLTGTIFYRPLGGGIEFGEYAEQTIVREMREEIGAEVQDLRYLFTLENIFSYNGVIGHEIVLVYDGKLVDASLYAAQNIQGQEIGDLVFTACWKSLDEFGTENHMLYPDGLVERLRGG